MYLTFAEKAKKLSVAQLEVLLLAEQGACIVHNEGAGFRCWLEKDGEKLDYLVRNQTANLLVSLNLFSLKKEETALFIHELHQDAKKVLAYVDTTKKQKAQNGLYRKGFRFSEEKQVLI